MEEDGGNQILAQVLVTIDFLPHTLDGVLPLHLALGLLGPHPVHQQGGLLNVSEVIVLLVREQPLLQVPDSYVWVSLQLHLEVPLQEGHGLKFII